MKATCYLAWLGSVAAAVLCLCTVAAAAPELRPGRYAMLVNDALVLLTIESDGSTQSVIVPWLVADGTPPVTPQPPVTDPPVTPQPPVIDPSTFAGQLAQRARAINEPTICSGFGEAFRILGERLDNGQLKFTDLNRATKLVLDGVQGQSSKREQWAQLRSWIGEEIANRNRRGTLATQGEYVAFYSELRGGFESAHADAAVDIDRLIRLITLILDLISRFKP